MGSKTCSCPVGLVDFDPLYQLLLVRFWSRWKALYKLANMSTRLFSEHKQQAQAEIYAGTVCTFKKWLLIWLTIICTCRLLNCAYFCYFSLHGWRNDASLSACARRIYLWFLCACIYDLVRLSLKRILNAYMTFAFASTCVVHVHVDQP